MLKVFKNEEKKQITAVVSGVNDDAIRIANRRTRYYRDFGVLGMKRQYTGTVTCDPRDTYDEEVGRKLAISKAMKNYRRGLRNAFVRWQVQVMKELFVSNPDTFDDAYNIVRDWGKDQQEKMEAAREKAKAKSKAKAERQA